MPARTERVIETALRAFGGSVIWVDAFCVPPDDPERTECVRSMGAIYSAAEIVVVVLSPAAASVLDDIRAGRRISDESLEALEADEWVTRGWTYQEMVNARAVQVLAEGDEAPPVSGADLMSELGKAMEDHRNSRGLDPWTFRTRRPRLDALESLIGDWEISAYRERSVFRVMGTMTGRSAASSDELFEAMVGSITTDTVPEAEVDLSASEYFIRVCERKGDFSFIYTSGDRSEPSWRPAPEALRPVLPWHSDGDRQQGEVDGSRLGLHAMALVGPGPVGEPAKRFIRGASHALGIDAELPWAEVPTAVLRSLRHGGFEGTGDVVELPCGYVFLTRPVPPDGDWVVAIANDIFWPFGAPALLVTRSAGAARLIDTGVFVGPRPAPTTSLDLE
jgi:hypothetical protein